jgi:hypothetical protein
MEGGSVRTLLVRQLVCVVTSLHARGMVRWSVACCLAVCLTGGLVGGSTAAEGQDDPPENVSEYSAYEDPDKAAVASILSDEGNAQEFRSEFDLDDEEMASVLAAAQKENETLAQLYAERQTQEVAASDYNERVRQAVAETKASIEAVLGEEKASRLKEWVDAKFAQEGQEAEETAVVSEQVSASGSRTVLCKVYATYYPTAYTRYEVALPHRALKFRDRYRKVPIRPVNGGRHVKAPVKEVGPWNTYDNYWKARTTNEKKGEWRNLPRCVPEAQAAFYDNFHGGKDEGGRTVTNPAGLDLSPGVAKRMRVWDRIQRNGKIRVYVRFPWVQR